jgi:hypothetical protein
MRILRRFIHNRSSGGLLAVCVAYSLAIQSLMASVGFGMSAVAAPGAAGFVICSFAANPSAHAPATNPDRQNRPRPECPFCFVAGQTAGHVATVGEAPAFPAYRGMSTADVVADRSGDSSFVPQFRHRLGEPRAPPAFSV